MPGQEGDITLSIQERRSMPRWEVKKPVFCHFEKDGSVYQGSSKDINYFGTSFAVNKKVNLSQDIYLAIKFSDDDIGYLHGKVVWHQPNKEADDSTVGVKFSTVDEKARDLIYNHSFALHRKEFIDNFFRGWGDD